MSFENMQDSALEIADLYTKLNARKGYPEWTVEDYTAGLVGDVGDLSKLTMAKAGKRDGQNTDEKIEHELNDCLWSVLVLMKKHGVADVPSSFKHAMDELSHRITTELVSSDED